MNVEVIENRFDSTGFVYDIKITEDIRLYSLKQIPLDRVKQTYMERYAFEEQRRD